MQTLQELGEAVADVGHEVRRTMTEHPGFEDVGKRMLRALAECVQGLRDLHVDVVD
ncbi:hypothetical protein [Limnohabitans sp. Jir72]|uniref:hypothetical protein n=1 Tax=Limnohabitans sp. Jir72 TaxID=1977909 RepID=UPI001304E9DC|nr:hypothetical protein [Limnohabitans sp. Jir72]